MNTPLFTALMKHQQNNPVSFHVPGHKNGKLFSREAACYFNEVLKLDVTELTGLDDLHDPRGVIREAEELAASLYGAERTYFLVNGSTAGNLAMILACCGEGDTVLVQRNSHKSVMNSLELAKADPVFLSPKIDSVLHVPSYVEEESMAEAIRAFPHAKALIVTNPNYYGVTADLSNTIRLAHSYGIPVLVDEAHGAHFGAGAPFPKSAIAMGADAVVQSAHKTLPAMTMGSYLHVSGSLLEKDRIGKILSMLQTSSPSYPIMASLDLARAYLQDIKESGSAAQMAENAREIREYFHSVKGIRAVSTSDPNAASDPLKFSLVSDCGLSGFELQNRFERLGVFGELADEQNFLLIAGLGNASLPERMMDHDAFLQGGKAGEKRTPVSFPVLPLTKLAFSYREMERLEKEEVHISVSAGRVLAEPIIPYPPGIPLVLSGEKISEQHISWILQLKKSGARFQGSGEMGTAVVYKKG
ncbi:aminotransferase class I/II-fold pyridoxal phosphate-dependent enzyme [Metabacillus sp. 84]|uniref:aminotransferase class I/II-fold pyridoxal phosphate-dependent enzyme n=1 Tax=unclassified Metabacillus TaxID=2675274 RepID=UPI003CF53FC9